MANYNILLFVILILYILSHKLRVVNPCPKRVDNGETRKCVGKT